MQVDLLDLKNVTTPSGTSSLTAYAMLRLKRKGGSAPLNHKARSLDSAITQSRKISKISGPNAPASWGSIVRFRFPLPEDVNCEGKSYDSDRESLFKVRQAAYLCQRSGLTAVFTSFNFHSFNRDHQLAYKSLYMKRNS